MDDTQPTDLPPLPPMERLIELMFDACRMGRDDVIPALLRAGVDIETLDARGHTPLVLATYNDREPTAALLLAEGARPDGPAGFTGNTALMGVAFKGYDAIARRLIDAGADVNYRNGAGQTALMMAVMFGQTAIVEMLLAQGADVAFEDAQGNSARSIAAAQADGAMAALLAR